jgi:hypothetical protein
LHSQKEGAEMPVVRLLIVLAAVLGLLPRVAVAQTVAQQPTQVQLQYHELVPADGDSTPVFLKIIEHIRRDCQLVGKAFGRKCVITNINIYANTNSGEIAGRMLNANATIMLPLEPPGSSPSPAAAPAAPSSATK